jgi:hypothetical protein
MALKDADDLLLPVVRQTLKALDLGPQDAATAKLAERIAANFDATTDGVYASRWLAPELLKVLAELGATPAARAAIAKGTKTGGDNAPAAVSRLDQLRTARAARRPAGP